MSKKIPPENNIFLKPPNKNTKIWRYISLSKFIHMVDTKELFLSRVSKLNDPHEGTYTKLSKILWEKFCSSNIIPGEATKAIQNFARKISDYTYVNCWYMDDEDSEAMWRLYCGDNEGVAIQTKYNKLEQFSIESDLHISMIRYIDYEKEFFGLNEDKKFRQGSIPFNFFDPFIHKRKSFSYEHEVRLIKQDIEDIASKFENNTELLPPDGISINFNLEDFVEKIYIHPYANDWFFDVVNSIINRYIPKMKAEWSPIKKEPFFLE